MERHRHLSAEGVCIMKTAQIDIKKGEEVVSLGSNWGTPKNIITGLRKTAKEWYTDPKSIAYTLIEEVEQPYMMGVIPQGRDIPRERLDYRYTVDVSARPWKVTIVDCRAEKV